MKLYICYGLFPSPRPGGHPCKNAAVAVREAGYDPEIVKSYGLGIFPAAMNMTKGRREIKKLTGNYWAPVLVTDDGTVVQGSHEIADWAREHPAGAGTSDAAAPAQA